MQWKNTESRWGLPAQLLHWLIALLIFGQAALGWYMSGLKLGPAKFELFALHKSIGITVLALVVVRALWRWTNATPGLPDTLKAHERVLAKATHALLYAVLFALPLSGYVINSAANFPLKVFGLFTVPNLIPENEALSEYAESVHETLIWVLVAILILHVAAALKHHIVLKDNVLRRMVPGMKLRP